MDDWEYYRALLLEVLIRDRGLTPAEFSQLQGILDLQYREDCYTEVLGSIFNREKRLDFEVIRPPELSEVENALKSFRQRDFSKIDLLADYISRGNVSLKKYHGENLDLRTAEVIFNVAAKKPASLVNFDEKIIQLYFDFYKRFLECYSEAFGKDLKVDEKGFLSIFHCHKDGSRPSPLDIQVNVNSGIPDIVISAKEDYLESGVTLYLITGGEVKDLYCGPIK